MIRSYASPFAVRLASCAVLAAAAVLAAPVASAEKHALAAKAGLLGLGVEYAHSIGDRLALRIGWNGSQIGFEAEESGIDYDFDLVWDSAAVTLDFHPRRGPMRVFAGLLRNDNRLDAKGLLNDQITIGDTTYDSDDVGTLIGRVGFDDTATFLGVGWDWSRRGSRRIGVSFDVGVLRQGSPVVSLRATGPIAGFPEFADDIAAEEAELADAIEDFELLPFATLGVVFRF